MSHTRLSPSRWRYLCALAHGLVLLWPIVSGLLVLKAGLGAIVGCLEGWGLWQGVYFAFITGLTIGYGDRVPSGPVTQFLAVAIGLTGVVFTGLIAALAVRAFDVAPRLDDT